MHKRLLIPLLLCCAACAPVAPQLDSRFGSSVRNLMAQQALPSMPANADGDAGMDGAAARGALSRYRQSFQSTAPAPAPTVFFNAVGGGNGR
ncbi:hypothetical protein KTQ42_12505|uniref:hypothetical protein n=1 Tax=Noviherbaspirillum sp. L7-7A TaxID=2850560 RepID=UPI001C2C3A11|nr:hypothetical protein [Noviherbaspirillum sp. L7-7A]MBV0880123.1 hypothetical protein [Noviherbaspirillum sp. L7-7A]